MFYQNFSARMLPFFTLQYYPGVGDIYKCVLTSLSFLSVQRLPSTADIFSAMMSGDSPNSHSKEYFDFKEGRSTPPPTTSKDIAVQSGSGTADAKTDVVAASVLAEPPKEHGPGTNYVGIIEPHADRKQDDEIVATEDKPLKNDDHPEAGDKRDISKKINGTIDKVDGNLAPSLEKKQEEEEDDSCAVKCLYYTLQCCECTVM